MNPRGFLIPMLWAGSLAFFGYLLVIAIPLVAPTSNAETVEAVVKNGREAIVAFFGFLGGIIGLLQHLGVRTSEIESEESVSTDDKVADVAADQYKVKLHQTYNAAKKLKKIAQRNRHVGIKAMSYRVAINVALLFALCHIVTAGLQGVLQRAYPLGELQGAAFFVVAFSQTLMLCICSCLVPLYFYRRFLANTKYSSAALSTGSVFRAGGLGMFVVGVASLTTLSPEQLSTLLGNESLRTLPVLQVNYMAYLAFVRLLVFPSIGIVTCFVVKNFR